MDSLDDGFLQASCSCFVRLGSFTRLTNKSNDFALHLTRDAITLDAACLCSWSNSKI